MIVCVYVNMVDGGISDLAYRLHICTEHLSGDLTHACVCGKRFRKDARFGANGYPLLYTLLSLSVRAANATNDKATVVNVCPQHDPQDHRTSLEQGAIRGHVDNDTTVVANHLCQ